MKSTKRFLRGSKLIKTNRRLFLTKRQHQLICRRRQKYSALVMTDRSTAEQPA